MIDVYVDNGKHPHMSKNSLEAYGLSEIHITHMNQSVVEPDKTNYWLKSYGLDSWSISTTLDLPALVDYLCGMGYTVKLW